MKKLIAGKVRDSAKLERVAKRSGNPNECYSTFSIVLHDPRDGKFFHFHGHHWGGLGDDQLELIDSPAEFIEEQGYELSDEDAAKLADLLNIE